MKNWVTFYLFFIFFVTVSKAVPAAHKAKVYEQIDGTTVTLFLIGDENFHCYATIEGNPVLKSSDGGYYYAIIEEDSLSCSNILVHDSSERLLEESEIINLSKTQIVTKINEIWSRRNVAHNTISKSSPTTRSIDPHDLYMGQKKGLVILVNFADQAMIDKDANARYFDMFNLHGYSLDNHIGSVSDYFYDQSYGAFDITFDIAGPVTLSRSYGYYGQNIGLDKGDKYAATMVAEACKAVDGSVDFRKYDWNNDGFVETVFVVYAGYGENGATDSETIWPHKSSLSAKQQIGDGEGAIELDGVKVDVYACASELAGGSGKRKNGIGTACHEFSHCLGLPDLYDTDYSGAFGMNSWDLMDSGSYSGPDRRGEVPYGYSAFERSLVGWLTFEELKNSQFYEIAPLNDTAQAFVMRNEAYENEFFVIENHQADKWFSYTGIYKGSHGLMISHIDYDEQLWRNNNVNPTSSHMRESIIPADNSYGKYDAVSKSYYLSEAEYKGDLFPGIKGVSRLSPKSHETCGGKLFNKNTDRRYYMSQTIDNISENNGFISFSVGNSIKSPNGIEVVLKGKTKLEVFWNPVSDVDTYTIEVTKLISILPYKTETEIITDIRDLFYIVDNVNCKQCSVRLKSQNEFVSSDWSEYVRATDVADAIETIEIGQNNSEEFYSILGIRTEIQQPHGICVSKKTGKLIYIK